MRGGSLYRYVPDHLRSQRTSLVHFPNSQKGGFVDELVAGANPVILAQLQGRKRQSQVTQEEPAPKPRKRRRRAKDIFD